MGKKTKSSFESLLHLIDRNDGEVGRHISGLLNEDLGKWERRVISLLARSKAYRENDLSKLLELANDIKATHSSQIQFVEKYVGDIFAPIAIESLKMEQEETEFLDKEIIPFLIQLSETNSSS